MTVRLLHRLTGVRFVVLYIAVLLTVAFVATLIEPGGPF